MRQFVGWIHRTLAIRSGKHLDKFLVWFTYHECFASDVNLWMDFCVKSKVKNVDLLFLSQNASYMLPQIIYLNSSLTCLSIGGCIIAPQRAVEWGRLTTLHLREVSLSQHVFENILTGCPVLAKLILRGCWGLDRLDVNSCSLVELGILGWREENPESQLEISAPYINSLVIMMCAGGKKLRPQNVLSLVSMKIIFSGPFWGARSVELMSYMKGLFGNLPNVKKLELGGSCIEFLSVLVMNGWRLPQSRLECLIVEASRDDRNILGIIDLLESSPDLETLIIRGKYRTYETFVVFGLPGPYIKWGDLNCDLLHLKTANITSFADPNLNCEPMLTLARILLKRAVVLKEMVIDVKGVSISSNDYTKIAEELLSYRRSSQKAAVLLCQ